MRIFLVDVISMTRANCAQPMTYYTNLVVVLLGLKIVLVLLLVGPWLWGRIKRGNNRCGVDVASESSIILCVSRRAGSLGN